MKSILNCETCANIQCQAAGICPVDRGLNASEDKETNYLKKGDFLFKEDQPAETLFFIQSGSITLYKKEFDGKVSEVSTLHAGSMVGMEAIYPYGYYIASGKADSNCSVVSMSRSKFLEISGLCSFASTNMISHIVSEFNQMSPTGKVEKLKPVSARAQA